MKIPYSCSRTLLALASVAALMSGRRSVTDELQDALNALTRKAEAGEILAQDPKEISAEEIKKWKARHPGLTLNISYPKKDLFNVSVRLKDNNTQRFNSFKIRRPARLWQPNGQVPRREKQKVLKENQSPYR
jgi:hypothetical protein